MSDGVDVTVSEMLSVGILGGPVAARAVAARVTSLAAPDELRIVVADDAAADDGAALAQAARDAEAAGVDVLVVADGAACAHLFDLERAVSIPVVSVIEEVGAELARRAPAGAAVGVLVDDRAAGLYRAELARRGVPVTSVDDAVLLVVDGTCSAPGGRAVIEVTQTLAEQVVAYARRERPLPPPFAWTEVGPA